MMLFMSIAPNGREGWFRFLKMGHYGGGDYYVKFLVDRQYVVQYLIDRDRGHESRGFDFGNRSALFSSGRFLVI